MGLGSEMKNFSISWNNYTEEEIHLIICSLFNSLDYHIKNHHKSDRANEDGADIIVNKDKEDIAIAVKIKPKEKDRAQLIELSERKEKRKIYVYVETPTDKFAKFTKSATMKNVEFWDTKKLNDFFRETNPYLMANIIFESSELHKILETLKIYLMDIWRKNNENKKKKRKTPPLNKESFKKLWRLKDVAVTLNKSTSTIEPLLNQPLKFKDKNLDIHFVNVFENYLELLARDTGLFLKHFIAFEKDNPILVRNGILTGLTTSHWFWIFGFKTYGTTWGMGEILEKSIENKELMDKLKKEYIDKNREKELEKLLEKTSKGNSIWEAMAYQVGKINLFGRALEIIIDDIVSEYIGEDTHLFRLD